MRISDWSSDVCSSDLHAPSTRKTLLALTLAAAFGGFAAIAIRAGLEQPANAETAAPAVLPAVSALPTTVAGQPLPSLAPMLEKVTPAVVSVRTRQVVRVSPFGRSEEHTSELQSLMRISYAGFCLYKKKNN